MMERKLRNLLNAMGIMALFYGLISTGLAANCQPQTHSGNQNLTVSVTVQLPNQSSSVPTGTVLYRKEATLAQLTGSHHTISNDCAAALKNILAGHLSSAQRLSGVYDTALPGLGIRVTVILDKPGLVHKEWRLPFNAHLPDFSGKSLTTDDIKVRLETIKTGFIQSGTKNIHIPSLITLSDNSLVVNLIMNVLAEKSHCEMQMPSPQIDIPPIDAAVLAKKSVSEGYDVKLNLLCTNTKEASLTVEGINSSGSLSILQNVSEDTPASGVGIEMLYNGTVMKLNNPVEIALHADGSSLLPLSVRYAKIHGAITQGKVKAEITLRINYL